MSFNPIPRIRRGLITIDPYFNDEQEFEFGRVVASALLAGVGFSLYIFRGWLADLASGTGVYAYTAKFYLYALVEPLLYLPNIYRYLTEIPLGDKYHLSSIFSVIGTSIAAFAFISIYMWIYTLFLALRRDYFRIGDFLGIWSIPLFISGVYFFVIMAWAELQLFLS